MPCICMNLLIHFKRATCHCGPSFRYVRCSLPLAAAAHPDSEREVPAPEQTTRAVSERCLGIQKRLFVFGVLFGVQF